MNRPLSPSAKLAIYVVAVAVGYILRRPATAIIYAAFVVGLGGLSVRAAGRPIPHGRLRVLIVFVAWVLVMRVALDVVAGMPLADPGMWLTAGRSAARVSVLGFGVLVLASLITPRDIVEELEHSRLPRELRLLVMMLVQYPRVLRDRYEQIVEAQVARGANRPRSALQRAAYGGRVLLPVMQSELNAVGDRAALLNVRRLDASAVITSSARDDITLDHFTFTYAASDKPALTDVSLTIPSGRITSVISEQGLGKTTLLRALAGLLGTVFHGETSGTISVPPAGAFFEGYVQVTLTVETVREEIGLPLMASGFDRAERDARTGRVAKELEIENLLDKNVTALSGGEEKLVGIAAALVCDTKLFVLDEPFEQLDVHHFIAVIQAVKRRAREGAAVLVATGSIDTAVNIADAAVVCTSDGWRYIEHPSYAIATNTNSAVEPFAARRGRALASVRRFRDAVAP